LKLFSLAVVLLSMDVNGLPTDVEELKKLLLQTQSSLAQTQQQVATLSSTVDALSTTVDDQAKKLAAKEQQIIELLKALRGKQRERIDPDQLVLFEIGELESLIEEQLDESRSPSGKRRKRKRRLIPDGLPEEIIEHELPEDEHRCPLDGQVMPRIRWEESKQLDYTPAQMKVIIHRRAVYACGEKHDEAKLVTAPKPPQPIEKGLPAAGLLAQVVVSKFGDHLPAYRQEDIFSRHGIEIRRSTIYGWLAAMADLCQPLVELMKQEVLRSKVIHTDDTQVKLIDKALRGTKLARFWGYLGDARHPYAVYDFTEDRSRAGPEGFLDGYHGYLQADAYGGYDGIYLDSSEADPSSGIVEVACWTHCRRYWHKARESSPAAAHHVLAVITRLYEIETATAGVSSEVRQAMRAEHATPLLTELGQWLDDQAFLPKSLIGKAATYTRNQWKALNCYVEDGDLSIDNNFAERAMRPIAIGRKNWLFVGSQKAGERAAVLASLVASCKNNLVEPWAYLRDLFGQMASQPTGDQLQELLPDRWLARNPRHRWEIAERRREERNAKAYL
jgi:transposase